MNLRPRLGAKAKIDELSHEKETLKALELGIRGLGFRVLGQVFPVESLQTGCKRV